MENLIGCTVVCVSPGRWRLTKNREYTVLDVNRYGRLIKVLNDSSFASSYSLDRFVVKTVSQPKVKQKNKILIEDCEEEPIEDLSLRDLNSDLSKILAEIPIEANEPVISCAFYEEEIKVTNRYVNTKSVVL